MHIRCIRCCNSEPKVANSYEQNPSPGTTQKPTHSSFHQPRQKRNWICTPVCTQSARIQASWLDDILFQHHAVKVPCSLRSDVPVIMVVSCRSPTGPYSTLLYSTLLIVLDSPISTFLNNTCPPPYFLVTFIARADTTHCEMSRQVKYACSNSQRVSENKRQLQMLLASNC